MPIRYTIDCSIKGAKCYLAKCCEAGACQALHGEALKEWADKKVAEYIAKGEKNVLPSQSPTPPQKQCHIGLFPVGKVGKAQIWLGREAAVAPQIEGRPKPVALIINCAMEGIWGRPKDSDELVVGNGPARKMLTQRLFVSHPPTPQMSIDWPDFGTPGLRKSWWLRLNAALSSIDGDVIFHCVGGHGRTGTAASILACLNGWVKPDQCPVTWLRARYCRKVVESEEQIIYIEEMTGWKVHAQPAKWTGYVGQFPPAQTTVTLHPRGKTPSMSLRRYAKFLRTPEAKKRPNLPTVADLKTGPQRIVVVGQDWFRFDPDTKTFTFLPNSPGAT